MGRGAGTGMEDPDARSYRRTGEEEDGAVESRIHQSRWQQRNPPLSGDLAEQTIRRTARGVRAGTAPLDPLRTGDVRRVGEGVNDRIRSRAHEVRQARKQDHHAREPMGGDTAKDHRSFRETGGIRRGRRSSPAAARAQAPVWPFAAAEGDASSNIHLGEYGSEFERAPGSITFTSTRCRNSIDIWLLSQQGTLFRRV